MKEENGILTGRVPIEWAKGDADNMTLPGDRSKRRILFDKYMASVLAWVVWHQQSKHLQ